MVNFPFKHFLKAKTDEKIVQREPWGIKSASAFYYPGLLFEFLKTSCTNYCVPPKQKTCSTGEGEKKLPQKIA